MYLSKNRYQTYYTRIPLKKSLKDKGLPHSIRISLDTKIRQEAIDRNLSLSKFIRDKLGLIGLQASPVDAWEGLKHEIKLFKNNHYKEQKPSENSSNEGAINFKPSVTVDLFGQLTNFLDSKQAEKISYRSIKQLELRINHFIKWFVATEQKSVTSKYAMLYRDFLIKEGRSYKTNHSYLAAINQFFKYCSLIEVIENNPFENIKLGQKPHKKKSEERLRWQPNELITLFSYLAHQRKSNPNENNKEADFWIPLICLFSGMRINEICQLRASSIKKRGNLYYFEVDSADDDVELKSINAYRNVPVHSYLLSQGVLDFVNSKKTDGNELLFQEKGEGSYKEYGRNVSNRFNRLLNKLGFVARNRPTIYSLRHTFVDELQQKQVSENIVADLVGHSKSNITFGRYGKTVNLKLLKEKLELVDFKLM